MLYSEVIYQGADPGGNMGGAFTASLAERELITKAAYLHSFYIGLKADTATAAVTAVTALGILNPFVFKVGQETRIQLRGLDLVALDLFLHGSIAMGFNADTTNDDFKIRGIRVPVYEKIDPKQTYSWSATYATQTNVSGEVLELAADWSDKVLSPNPLIAVEQPFTTAAATGRTNLSIVLPRMGDLIGLILFNTNNPTNVADASSVQRLQLYMNGNRGSQYNIGTRGWVKGFAMQNQALLNIPVLDQYSFIDLRDDPIDAKANEIGIEVDVEDASDACRIIPVMLKK